MATPSRPKSTDTGFRVRLLLVAVCWLLIAAGNAATSEGILEFSNLIVVFSVISVVLTALLAFRPRIDFAFLLGGAIGVGALALRAVLIVEAQLKVPGSELIWVTITQFALATLLGFLYAWWWLTDVKSWHVAHRQ